MFFRNSIRIMTVAVFAAALLGGGGQAMADKSCDTQLESSERLNKITDSPEYKEIMSDIGAHSINDPGYNYATEQTTSILNLIIANKVADACKQMDAFEKQLKDETFAGIAESSHSRKEAEQKAYIEKCAREFDTSGVDLLTKSDEYHPFAQSKGYNLTTEQSHLFTVAMMHIARANKANAPDEACAIVENLKKDLNLP